MEAYDRIDTVLTRQLGARELDEVELGRYAGHRFARGWEVPGVLADRMLRLRILLPSDTSEEPARFAIHPAPPVLTWPNVEISGLLCLAGEHYSVDKPLEVTQSLLEDAVRLANEVTSGGGRERFREEFSSYWIRWENTSGRLYSLCDVSGSSRNVTAASFGSVTCVADSDAEARLWLGNRNRAKPKDVQTARAIFIQLPEAPLPEQYPRSVSQLMQLVGDQGGRELIKTLLVKTAQEGSRRFVVLSFPTGRGRGVAALRIAAPMQRHGARAGAVPGFRPGRTPRAVIFRRQLGCRIIGYDVARVDAPWVHGRESNQAAAHLRAKSVIVLGAGSLGAGVAKLLLQSGVGHLAISDGELMAPENASRHELGVDSAGRYKAEALAEVLSARFPHSRIEVLLAKASTTGRPPRPANWQRIIAENPGAFSDADLLVSAIGEWPAERGLEVVALEAGAAPAVLYGWLEPRALAAHSVVVMGKSGGLSCLFDRDGEFKAPAVSWCTKPARLAVPACAGSFEPYGAIELSMAHTLVARHALDYLCAETPKAEHRAWLASSADVEKSDGLWNTEWQKINGDPGEGARMVKCTDYPCNNCAKCSSRSPAAVV